MEFIFGFDDWRKHAEQQNKERRVRSMAKSTSEDRPSFSLDLECKSRDEYHHPQTNQLRVLAPSRPPLEFKGKHQGLGSSILLHYSWYLGQSVWLLPGEYGSFDLGGFETSRHEVCTVTGSNLLPIFRKTTVIRRHGLLKLLLSILVAFLPQVFADPNQLLYRTRMVLLAGSGITSLGTGMAAMQLEIPGNPERTKFVKMSLRIVCSTFLGTLIVGYSLWFLSRRAQKTQRFVYALCTLGIFFWLFMRGDSSSESAERGDTFTWLDNLNFLGLFDVVIAILNAESRFIQYILPRDGIDEDDDNNRRHSETHPNTHNDEESQSGTSSRDSNSSNNDTGDIGLASLLLSSV
ncbi:hypothetical protein QBC41DRAFT_311749 [Cercophora samala]|uniref:Uncharacterized protein n=1 Tax=Cercophora samala TaxID=330535 RepID=A0AA39ZLW8_9PEZI|nr:hypothetical protein QBC41DRAFT_311749 [Cercophora samala]